MTWKTTLEPQIRVYALVGEFAVSDPINALGQALGSPFQTGPFLQISIFIYTYIHTHVTRAEHHFAHCPPLTDSKTVFQRSWAIDPRPEDQQELALRFSVPCALAPCHIPSVHMHLYPPRAHTSVHRCGVCPRSHTFGATASHGKSPRCWTRVPVGLYDNSL